MNGAIASPDARLAEMAAGLCTRDVPGDVKDAAIDCIIDTIAVAFAGSDHAVSNSVSCVAHRGGAATVIGRSWTSSIRDAALLNAISAHVLDFDDWLPAAGLHPSSPVLAAALAAAESRPAPVAGTDLLAAYIAGLETQARIGAAIAPAHYAAGFHPTATIGAFGAAVAAAHVSGATPAAIGGALGIVSTAASGIRVAFGTAAKSIQVGRAAESGVLAAQLIAAGASAPSDAVLGERGFAATHGHAVAEHVTAVPFADHWYLREVAVKRHASCFGTHAPIDAILELRDRCPSNRLTRIDVTVSDVMRTVCAIPVPATSLEGKFSLAFATALAWARGRCGVADFTDQTIRDPWILDVARCVVVGFDPEFRPQQGRVRITLDDGTVFTAEHDSALPVPSKDRHHIVREKLAEFATPVLSAAGAANLLEVIEGLAPDQPVSALTAALRCSTAVDIAP